MSNVDQYVEELMKARMEAVPPKFFGGLASSQPSPKQYNSGELVEMVEMRLRKPLKFDHIHAYKHKEEFVHFLIWVKGELVTLKDDWGLFPSDQLITQIRLLETQ